MTLPITAIVPVRNAASHLRQALDSVSVAGVAETIVIDGGSTDGSIEIAASTPNVRLLHQRTRGLAAARNEALAAATQPFIAFCDADDRWESGGLVSLHATLAANEHALAAIGLVMPAALEGHEPTAAQRSRIGTPLPGFTPGAMLARWEAFEAVGGFDESLAIGADSDWFVRLVQSGLGPVRSIGSCSARACGRRASRPTSNGTDANCSRIAAGYVARRRRGVAMRLLHLIPRFIGGGPERDLLAMIAAWRTAGVSTEHEILVLDPPVSAPLLLRARRFGVPAATADPTTRRSMSRSLAPTSSRSTTGTTRGCSMRCDDRGPRHGCSCARRFVGRLARRSPPPNSARSPTICSPRARVRSPRRPRRRFANAATWPNCRRHLADMSRLAAHRPRADLGIRIGYVGLVGPAKLHPRFAELCAAVRRPEVGFDVYGPGQLDALRQRFEELGLADRAIVHGPTEDLAAAFSGLDAIGHPLAPGGYAASEAAVQEAMWVGLPVVVLAETGADDLIEHEVSGLVAADEHEYPRQLERLVDDAPLRRRLGENARAFAREHFDPDRNARRFHAIFESMLGRPKRGRPPMPGAGEPAARRFVQSMGHLAGPFAISLDGASVHGGPAVAAAESEIAASPGVVADAEGGVIHHRNTFPEDPHLRMWSGLIARSRGEGELAERELAFAAEHGVRPRS